MQSSTPRPPALTPATARSYQVDPADLDALVAALVALGATPQTPTPAEMHRVSYAGGLALCYGTGAVVVAGPHPAALLRLLDRWAGRGAGLALLVRRGPNSWHAPSLPALLATLDAHPELEKWNPRPGADARAKNETARYYHRPAWVRGRVEPAAIVVSGDGWCRCTGTDPQRVAAILDALSAEPAPVEDDAPQAQQLGLFLMTGGR